MVGNLVSLIRLLCKHVSPFTLHPEGFSLAPRANNPRMIWLRLRKHPEFLALVKKIGKVYEQIQPGQQLRKSPIPHITLSRLKGIDGRRTIQLGAPLPDTPLTVSRLIMWESHLSHSQAAYSVIAEYAL